jgi:glutamate synthase (NADPH/NADH) small chain
MHRKAMSEHDLHSLNSKYAWRELSRRDLPKRSAPERVADFLEIYGLYDENTAREQASRCLQCPNPSCVGGCPLCNPIPEWMRLTAEGRFLEAAAVLGSASNLADICSRLCPGDRLCEGTCLLGSMSDPVPIQAIERFLIDYAFAHGPADVSTAPPNGRKVAVVGSGPGPMACADALAKQGYSVTIFDSSLLPGGLMVSGAPAFKIEKSVVERRVEMLRKRGVVFELGASLWQEMTLGRLMNEFDAVYLGLDSRKARALEIPGGDLKGVVQALPFLLQKTTPLPLELPPIDVAGKRVVVIGGGDSALDCLRAALRYGAREAIGIYRREAADMPCSRRDYQSAVEEGVRFMFCATPSAIIGNEDRRAIALRLLRTELGPTEDRGPRPFLVLPATEFDLTADWVVAALGFDPLPCSQAGDLSELSVNERGGVVVDGNQMTNLPGVFAGGDVVRGPTRVLEAVRDARKAAEQIHAFLSQVSKQKLSGG